MTDFQTATDLVDKHYPAGEQIRFAWAIDAVMEAVKQEREACAALCDDHEESDELFGNRHSAKGAEACAAAIRARSSVADTLEK